ncbi:hypothetical protein [uncultured Enterovirga sp.]|uniref:hypothetical protein n=1 Tax=uncultured Enterovirga sp. TaxID=2026352 RepID=UPI0035C9E96B
MPDRSPFPLIPHHQPDDMLLRLELLRDEASAAGQGTLAYLIEVAMVEAKRISDQERRDVEERAADPWDLWRPV